jgi:DnaJ-class molecular chaperone
MTTHYDILDVDRKATAKAVLKAYERRMNELRKHPDPLRERFVKDAYSVLSNPLKRTDYDSKIGESEMLAASSPSGAPLLVGIAVVVLTAAGIGYFLWERSKDKAYMRIEEQRAAEREKAKRPATQQPSKRQEK